MGATAERNGRPIYYDESAKSWRYQDNGQKVRKLKKTADYKQVGKGAVMSALQRHAKYELQRAGLFKKDGDYNGMIGSAVMDLVKIFSKQGHSGASASLALFVFNKVARYKLLSPIKQPVEGHYQVINDERTNKKKVLQHLRLSTLFSNNGGKDWHDIDAKRTLWDKILRRHWHPVKFPYFPKERQPWQN